MKVKTEQVEQVAWGVTEWARATGFCHASVYNLLKAGKIRSAKVGAKRLILTSPRDFVEAHAAPGGPEAA